MGEFSLQTVGLGALTISGTGALITGVYTSIARPPRPLLLVTAAAMNSGLTGATFFAVREFAVSPALTRLAPFDQYARRRQEYGLAAFPNDEPSSSLTPSDVRKNRLLDSAVSGSIAGSILRGFRSGRQAVVPGFMMGALLATLAQYGCNELNLARLRYASKLSQENRTIVQAPVIKPRNSSVPVPENDSTRTWMGSFLEGIGLTPISDEDYISRMKKTREVYLKRIAELEAKLKEENPQEPK